MEVRVEDTMLIKHKVAANESEEPDFVAIGRRVRVPRVRVGVGAV